MAKDLKTLALARLSGFRHKTVKVPEWRKCQRGAAGAFGRGWYLWQEVLNGDGEDDDTLSVVAKTRRNLEADVTLFAMSCVIRTCNGCSLRNVSRCWPSMVRYMPGCCVRHWN